MESDDDGRERQTGGDRTVTRSESWRREDKDTEGRHSEDKETRQSTEIENKSQQKSRENIPRLEEEDDGNMRCEYVGKISMTKKRFEQIVKRILKERQKTTKRKE